MGHEIRVSNNQNSKSTNGAMSELMACTWLLEQGYEVFRNVSPHGDNDVVVYDKETKEYTGYDVKTANYYVNKHGVVTVQHAKNNTGIPYILVCPDGKIMFSEGDKITLSDEPKLAKVG